MKRRIDGVEAPQTARDLGSENFGQGRRIVSCDRDVQRDRTGSTAGHPIHQRVRLCPKPLRLGDLNRKAPHVFDQHDPQRDCDGPKLADQQRRAALIGLHELPQNRAGNQAVGVGNIGPGDGENTRIAGKMAFGQFGQLAVKARRKILGDLAQLQFHQMEIVQQPFRRRRDRLSPLDGTSAESISVQQDIDVVAQSSRQAGHARWVTRNAVRGRKRLGVVLQPFGAEKFRPDWRGVTPDCVYQRPHQASARCALALLLQSSGAGRRAALGFSLFGSDLGGDTCAVLCSRRAISCHLISIFCQSIDRSCQPGEGEAEKSAPG